MIRIALLLSAAAATLATALDGNWSLQAATYPPWGNLWYDGSPQGIANDDATNTLIFSGKHMLRRATRTFVPSPNGVNSADTAGNTATAATGKYEFKTVGVLHDMIPAAWAARGYDHCGDADTVPGTRLVLVPVEEPSYTRPALFLYNSSDDLGTFHFVSGTVVNQKHMPWVAHVQPTNASEAAFLVSSEYDNVTAVHAYTWPGAAFLRMIAIERVGPRGLMHVQGGVVRHGVLYLSTDQNENPLDDDVFAFDLSTSPARLLYSFSYRFTHALAEVEGLTVDGAGRMWVVTNCVEVDPLVYTFVRP